MYEVGKCPKHSWSKSLLLLRHCRDPMESYPSPRINVKILKIRRRLRYHTYCQSSVLLKKKIIFLTKYLDEVILHYYKKKWAHKTEILQERWHIKKAENYGRFIDYAFSNAIRLIVFLNTRKLVKFYQIVFCFFKI